jgi:hypothetical protein
MPIDAELLDGLERQYASKPQEIHAVPPEPPWPVMADVAFCGLAGEAVKVISPHSEADPVALLIQFLVMAGNVIGRLPYYQVESDRHRVNLFCALVGDSSKGRKGTSMGRVRAVLKATDADWEANRLKSGLASGEGVVFETRDLLQKWDVKTNQLETVDPGVTDKRLMVVEPEFAGVLSVAERPGNTLSPVIRRAWDGDRLATITRNAPLCATDPHISLVAHVTTDELRVSINRTEICNGFANRFLFVLIRRSKELPFGGDLDETEILRLGQKLTEVLEKVRAFGRVSMTFGARVQWKAVYSALSAAQPGLLGAVTARAEAQVVRLALLYALLDGMDKIDEPHLRAALAVWEYCEASAARIFGDLIGDPMADQILAALRQAETGLTRTQISDLFGRNRSADRIGAALLLLQSKGRARMEMRDTAGRPAERWFAKTGARYG